MERNFISTHDATLNGVVVLVTQLCPTLCHPIVCSPSGSSVHGIIQARTLDWVAISFSRGYTYLTLSSVQFSCWVVSDSVTPWIAARQASLSITKSRNLLKLTSQCCHPTISSSVIPFSSCPQSLPESGSFSNESTLRMRWPKYWNFSFSISPSIEGSGLISFRIDWLDLLAVLGTLRSLLQYHSSKASILLCSAFFTVQLSHPYMTTGKTMALTRQTLLCWQSNVSAL